MEVEEKWFTDSTRSSDNNSFFPEVGRGYRLKASALYSFLPALY